MSTELTVVGGAAVSRYDNPEIISTIKQTVCKGATDAQLRVFLEVCKRTGLDPFLKEIWYVAEKSLIMAARDGYLRVANEHPMFDGMETRVERDDKKVPIRATCTVYRKDRAHPITCEAYYSEYKKSSPVWTQYPSAMISKVAEVLALKRSFAINGVVTEEEVGNDGSGSVAAAQSVAEAKIAKMKTGVPYSALSEPQGECAALELERSETFYEPEIEQARPQKPYDKFAMYKALGVIKEEFQSFGREDVYRECLRKHGSETGKRDGLPCNDGGKAARKCYRELGALLASLRNAEPEEVA